MASIFKLIPKSIILLVLLTTAFSSGVSADDKEEQRREELSIQIIEHRYPRQLPLIGMAWENLTVKERQVVERWLENDKVAAAAKKEEREFRNQILGEIVGALGPSTPHIRQSVVEDATKAYEAALREGGVEVAVATREGVEYKRFLYDLKIPSTSFDKPSGMRHVSEGQRLMKKLYISTAAAIDDAVVAKEKGDLQAARNYSAQALALLSYAHGVLGKSDAPKQLSAHEASKFYFKSSLPAAIALILTGVGLQFPQESIFHNPIAFAFSAAAFAGTTMLTVWNSLRRDFGMYDGRSDGKGPLLPPRGLEERVSREHARELMSQFWDDVGGELVKRDFKKYGDLFSVVKAFTHSSPEIAAQRVLSILRETAGDVEQLREAMKSPSLGNCEFMGSL